MSNQIQTKPASWFGKLMARLRCLQGVHAPDRTRVRKDGLFYVGKCQACGKPIRKRNGRQWKPYKS